MNYFVRCPTGTENIEEMRKKINLSKFCFCLVCGKIGQIETKKGKL